MLANRIIPSLLLRGGRLVKGVAFAEWRDAGQPATTVRAFNAQKADEVVLLDIDAAREGRSIPLAVLRDVAMECEMPLSVGGGIASADIAAACLAEGADKVVVNSTALDRPALLSELAERFGRQAVVLALDVITLADGSRHLYDHRTRAPVPDRPWLDWAREATALGAGEIRLMAVEREGTRRGMDTEMFGQLRAEVSVPVILEGGCGNLVQMDEAMRAGADSIALGTALVFSDNNIIQIKRHLKNAGFPIRM